MWLPMKKRTRYISRVLMLLYIAAVCLLCFADIRTDIGVNSTLLGIPADKIVHFTMFLPFPALMYAAFHRQERKPARKKPPADNENVIGGHRYTIGTISTSTP